MNWTNREIVPHERFHAFHWIAGTKRSSVKILSIDSQSSDITALENVGPVKAFRFLFFFSFFFFVTREVFLREIVSRFGCIISRLLRRRFS